MNPAERIGAERAIAVQADVSDAAAVERLVAKGTRSLRPDRHRGFRVERSAVIVFLASPLADYLNGVTIDVNGGSWFH